jgi:hypothetical protein
MHAPVASATGTQCRVGAFKVRTHKSQVEGVTVSMGANRPPPGGVECRLGSSIIKTASPKKSNRVRVIFDGRKLELSPRVSGCYSLLVPVGAKLECLSDHFSTRTGAISPPPCKLEPLFRTHVQGRVLGRARPWRFDYTDPSDERLAAMWLLSGSLETG